MTPEQQQIAIAEACGWNLGYTGKLFWVTDVHGIRSGWSNLRECSVDALPDYLNDLNAMHEAEKSCIVGQHDMEYREALESLCGQYSVIYHATAAQRAEAFLKTLNLWKP